jgi:hypothetical protein
MASKILQSSGKLIKQSDHMTYLKVVYKKEGVHWKRMVSMLKQFKGATKIIGFIGLIVLSLVHYAYLSMHTAYELTLFVFNRRMFESNLFKLQESLVQVQTVGSRG